MQYASDLVTIVVFCDMLVMLWHENGSLTRWTNMLFRPGKYLVELIRDAGIGGTNVIPWTLSKHFALYVRCIYVWPVSTTVFCFSVCCSRVVHCTSRRNVRKPIELNKLAVYTCFFLLAGECILFESDQYANTCSLHSIL